MIGGALAFLAGLQQLFARAELRGVLWRMILLLLVLMIVISGSVFWLADYVAGLWLPEGDGWFWQLLGWLAWLLALILALISGIVAFVVFGSAAAAPWLDLLAARVGGTEEDEGSWLAQSARSLANAVRPLFELLLWGGAALFCFWLPPLATGIWIYGGIRFLSFELLDISASRRAWDYSRRKRALDEGRWFYLGFSGLAALLIAVPLLNLFVIPAAVVGLELHLSGRDKPSEARP